MKIRKVIHNNRRKVFEVHAGGKVYVYPYSRARLRASGRDRVGETVVDRELGGEAFTYVLASGKEGTVHVEQVLDYNKDPDYMTDLLLYKLTLEARRRVENSALSAREVIRRLRTSPAQFYRLLDPTNYRKSVRQMVSLLYVLDCEVDLVVRSRKSA